MRRLLALLALLLWVAVPASAATVTTFLEAGTDATQDLTFFPGATGGGTEQSTTGQAFTGPRSLNLLTSSGGASGFVTTADGVAADTGTQVSFYWRTDTIPGATTGFWQSLTSGSSLVFNALMDSSGHVCVGGAGLTSVCGSTVLSVNTWYRLCISFYATNTTTFASKIYLEIPTTHVITLEATVNSGTLARTGTSTSRWLSQFGNSKNVWVDNIYIATGGASSSSQPDTGNILVTAKRPFSNGSNNQWTTQIGSGGSGYGTGHAPQVNEQPLSTVNGWSIQNAATQTEEYTVENASAGDVDITNHTLIDWGAWVYAKVASANTGHLIVGGTASNVSVTTSYSLFTAFKGSTTYPAGNTDVGMDTNSVNQLFSLAECGVLVAYNAAVNATAPNTLPLLGVGPGQ